jgi:hypothetical protein
MMFFWFSNNSGRSRFGCCGGILFLLPLSFLTFFGGFGSNGLLLMLIIVAVLAVMFVLPRVTGGQSGGKLKNDDLYDAYDEKSKRGGERYALTDDGEIIEVTDDEQSSL